MLSLDGARGTLALSLSLSFVLSLLAPVTGYGSGSGLICGSLRGRLESVLIPKSMCMRMQGGGRMPIGERISRRKFAEQQFKAGIGKSVWRREKGINPKLAKRNKAMEKVVELSNQIRQQTKVTLQSIAAGGAGSTTGANRDVVELDDIENQAKKLLENVQKQKNLVKRQARQEKKGKKKRMLTKGTVDDPRNWRSFF